MSNMYWKGKKLDYYSKAELIEIIEALYKLHEQSQKNIDRLLRL